MRTLKTAVEYAGLVAVETYNLKAANGRHVRRATQVRFGDGRVVRFMEKMSKKRAVEQALHHLAIHPEAFCPTEGGSGSGGKGVAG